jgi:outer membrane protein OmpA-like peptidoglycan-associated protein
MSRLKGVLILVAAALFLGAPARAQIAGRPIEVSGGGGLFSPDGRARMMDRFGSVVAIGWRVQPILTLEAEGSFGPSRQDTVPNFRHNFMLAGADLRWNLRPAEGKVVPFLLTGIGYGQSHTNGHPPEKLQRGAGSLGLGTLFNIFNQRTYVRLQVRDVWFREREAVEFSNHWFVTGGLQFNFGGKVHDSDLDGVRDWLDRCPATPLGAKVDVHGCPIDSDGDGVFDGLDKCPGTPRGCTIDANGCPQDADGDGVCDGLDQCAGTPHGATVDAKGCPRDTDGDGVLDGIDRCDNTVKGCTIDSVGCSQDTDGDGVCDGIDRCPNTPAGLRVDPNGCPIEVSVKETELLDTGTIRLQNIEFDTNKSTIKPESFGVIDTVAMILQQYPTLLIEIGGHTDNKGSKALNDTLSDSRAAAVLNYIRQKFPMIRADQFSSKGYGMNVPIAPNTSALGRAKNRRVEFRVLNTEALRIERERRRFLRTDETAPPDSTKK